MNDESKHYSRNQEIAKFQKKYICEFERYVRKRLKTRQRKQK